MRSLIRRRPQAARSDPSPSRWAWRIQRWMLTPGIRFALRAGVPFCLTLGLGTWYLGQPERQAAIQEMVTEARASIETRPEFMVNLMAIDGAEDTLSSYIRDSFPLDFPVSSFDLDLDVIRTRITEISAVKSAAVRIKPGGVLHVDVTPREAVALWRSDHGLTLIDASGMHVANATSRYARPDLPLVAGEGANVAVGEALDLMVAASPLGNRLRGLVRMGERRWDIVLDRDQRILLPEHDALRALERVIALENATDIRLLSRDVTDVDMRLSRRPTIRMTKTAAEERAAQQAAFRAKTNE